MSNLPAGWSEVPFEEAFRDVTGGETKTKARDYRETGRVPIVDQGRDLVGGFTDDPDAAFGGPLPVVVFGDHTKVVKYVDFDFGIGADGLKVLRPSSELDPKYAYRVLRSVRLPDGGYDRHFKYLKRTTVRVPPLEDQRRIAAVLDKADLLRAKSRRARRRLDSLTQAVFLDMFGDPAVNPKGWPLVRVGELGDVVTGNTPPRADATLYGDQLEWVKSDNIDPLLPFVAPALERLSSLGQAVARIAPPRSVLITCIAGSPSSIGNAAATDREVAFNQQINALVFDDLDWRFVLALVRASKRLIQAESTGGMKGIVSKSRLQRVTVPLPPTDLQDRFTQAWTSADRIRQDQGASSGLLDEVFASLQSQAFSGEL